MRIDHPKPREDWSEADLNRHAAQRTILAERLAAQRLVFAIQKRVAEAENLQRRIDQRRNQPVALAAESIDRDKSAMTNLLQGLGAHYEECLMARRLDIWASAAHQIIELLASPMTTVLSRHSIYADGPEQPDAQTK